MRSSALLTLAAAALSQAESLKLAGDHSGSGFFDYFKLNGSDTDPTNFGFIHYLNQSAATNAKLAYVNDAGNVILKVDNTTSDPNPGAYSTFGRDTVMVVSQDTISVGTLVVLDAAHLPYGCSVWPSFWTLNTANATDAAGEIDIIETVNMMPTNQYSLHASNGCKLANSSSMPYTGNVVYDDCNFDAAVTQNRGCGIQEKSQNAVGANFAKNGGGVYAMYWSTDAIRMWFFERPSIPSDLASGSPDPSSWPEASAAYPASGCDPTKFFQPQNLIINIDVCGAWAGDAAVFTSTGCTGTCSTLVGTATNYDNAYWEIKSVKTFTAAGGAGSSSSSAHASGSNTSAGSQPSTTGKNGAVRTAGLAGLATLVAAVGAAMLV